MPDAESDTTTQPVRPRRGALHGWRKFVQDGIARKGRIATQADVETAVRSLEADGILEADEAGALLAEPGRVDDLSLLDEVIHRVAETQGWSPGDVPDMQLSAGAGAPPHYAGINSPARWEGAKDAYQDAAARAVEAGEGAGDMELAELAGSLAAASQKVLSGPVRVLRVEALIAASSDPSTAARRKAYLRPLVARYTKLAD